MVSIETKNEKSKRSRRNRLQRLQPLFNKGTQECNVQEWKLLSKVFINFLFLFIIKFSLLSWYLPPSYALITFSELFFFPPLLFNQYPWYIAFPIFETAVSKTNRLSNIYFSLHASNYVFWYLLSCHSIKVHGLSIWIKFLQGQQYCKI